jgi:hypothetical protein
MKREVKYMAPLDILVVVVLVVVGLRAHIRYIYVVVGLCAMFLQVI